MKALLPAVLRIWIPIAVAVSLGALGLNVVGQQVLRAIADDPQVQIAHDGARALDAGAAPASLVPSGTIAADADLATFVMVYGPTGTVLAGNGTLGGEPVEAPADILETARTYGQNRIAWDAADDTQLAVAVFSADDGRTVLAGRSMSETDARQRSVQQVTGMGWLFALTITFFATWFSVKLLPARS